MELVKQRKGGCFAACVSMLTGIDYDLLPSITTNIRQYTEGDIEGLALESFVRVTDDYVAVDWSSCRKYYMFNYGIELNIHNKNPRREAMRVVANGHHVVVQKANGHFVDPDEDNRPAENDAGWGRIPVWVTIDEVIR